jgi:predicted dehydrogenase
VTLGVGIIGAGRMASIHAGALASLSGVSIVAVADPRTEAAEALAASFSAVSYTEYPMLLERSDVEAVAIAIPHNRHFQVVSDALLAGKHVFLEKPLASEIEDGRRLATLAAASPCVLMICHNLLFHPAVIRAQQLFEQPGVGRVTGCRAWSRGWLDLAPWDFRRSREATGGGAWIDCASHLLYVLERFLGPTIDITAYPNRNESRLEGEDTASGVARFASGCTATLEVSYADWRAGDTSWPNDWEAGYEIRGTNGRLSFTVMPQARVSFENDESQIDDLLVAEFDHSFTGALSAFVDSVSSGLAPEVGASDGLHILELMARAYQP